jgi:hypothetical protein
MAGPATTSIAQVQPNRCLGGQPLLNIECIDIFVNGSPLAELEIMSGAHHEGGPSFSYFPEIPCGCKNWNCDKCNK